MGGEQAFAAKLDAVFTSPTTFKAGTYGRLIHEMTEMVAVDMGQYAHGNEPVHHMIYLYDYAGQPWKTQSRVRRHEPAYQSTPDGLCGDEDTGQMSAWYVFSALGFYPVCPGEPLIPSAARCSTGPRCVAEGKTFTITAANNGPQHPYIRGAKLNGKPFDKVYLTHEQIEKVGRLCLKWFPHPTTNGPPPPRRARP